MRRKHDACIIAKTLDTFLCQVCASGAAIYVKNVDLCIICGPKLLVSLRQEGLIMIPAVHSTLGCLLLGTCTFVQRGQ
jgi:hypothetical protein